MMATLKHLHEFRVGKTSEKKPPGLCTEGTNCGKGFRFVFGLARCVIIDVTM